jgi:sulfide:quinone oxidoreductase
MGGRAVAEIDPEGRKVVTANARAVPYDFLIVATGLELHYAGIEGMDTARIGQDGLGSIYTARRRPRPPGAR